MSVMETFLHDPLCEWTKRHRSSEEADNPQAKDALATLEGALPDMQISLWRRYGDGAQLGE